MGSDRRSGQTIARAEDLATVAACLDPRTITMAVDNQGAVQGIWNLLRGAYRPERRHPALSYNADVRKALATKVIRCRGTQATMALKVKAHVDLGDQWRK